MKNYYKVFIIGLFTFIINIGFSQNQDEKCNKGPQELPPDNPPKRDPNPGGEGEVNVYAPSDPNEIIGTRGYDNLGDTMQWVAATASLPYTIYFENDPELATAQKVEERHRLHAKVDIHIFRHNLLL